jgi:hypothetical protein
MVPATKNRLGARLAVCQLLGTVCGLAVLALLPSGGPTTFTDMWWTEITILGVGALGFGIPAYALAVLVLHNLTRSILNHTFLWCVGLPGVLLAMSLSIPGPPHSIHWITAMTFCALLAGAMFLVWQRLRPMTLAT